MRFCIRIQSLLQCKVRGKSLLNNVMCTCNIIHRLSHTFSGLINCASRWRINILELPTSHFFIFLLSLAELGPFLLMFDRNSRHFYRVPRPMCAHESTVRIAILLETRGVSGHAPHSAKYWSGQNHTSWTACAGPDNGRWGIRGQSSVVKCQGSGR